MVRPFRRRRVILAIVKICEPISTTQHLAAPKIREVSDTVEKYFCKSDGYPALMFRLKFDKLAEIEVERSRGGCEETLR